MKFVNYISNASCSIIICYPYIIIIVHCETKRIHNKLHDIVIVERDIKLKKLKKNTFTVIYIYIITYDERGEIDRPSVGQLLLDREH